MHDICFSLFSVWRTRIHSLNCSIKECIVWAWGIRQPLIFIVNRWLLTFNLWSSNRLLHNLNIQYLPSDMPSAAYIWNLQLGSESFNVIQICLIYLTDNKNTFIVRSFLFPHFRLHHFSFRYIPFLSFFDIFSFQRFLFRCFLLAPRFEFNLTRESPEVINRFWAHTLGISKGFQHQQVAHNKRVKMFPSF